MLEGTGIREIETRSEAEEGGLVEEGGVLARAGEKSSLPSFCSTWPTPFPHPTSKERHGPLCEMREQDI